MELLTFLTSCIFSTFNVLAAIIGAIFGITISAIVLALIGLPVHYGAWMCILLGVCTVADILILKFVTQKPAIDFHDGCETTKTYWVEVVSLSTFLLGVILGVLTL